MLNSGGDPNFTIFGKTDLEIQPDPALGKKFYEEDLEIISSGNQMSYIQEMTFGELTFYYQITKKPIKDVDGSVMGIVGIVTDMTELIVMQKRLESFTFQDRMTGIYNRDYFEQRIKEFGPNEHYPVAVIMADSDNLKKVNDTLGHKEGDFLIESTISNFKMILPDDAEMIRMGGDEYLIILQNCDRSACKLYMAAITSSEQRATVGNISLSTSLGYCIIESEKVSLADAVEAADAMMYLEKKKRHREKAALQKESQ